MCYTDYIKITKGEKVIFKHPCKFGFFRQLLMNLLVFLFPLIQDGIVNRLIQQLRVGLHLNFKLG